MRKILVTLLAISMLLGLVGPAFATFSDAAGNKSVDKAAAFGWLKGYPDGTFKPNGNITRAEAAAVIVRALGLEAAAGAAKGLASRFADVPASHWASGYVNVCTSKNLLKGYPDGSFKPEANITQAEIITIIVRALNREFQAVGEWPIGHITVAAAEKIIGTGFASSALATRGMVAEWVTNAAEVVHGHLTANGWEVPAVTSSNAKTFVSQSGYKHDETLATDLFDVNSVDTTDLYVNGHKLDDNYRIAGGVTLANLKGYKVKAFWNNDRTKIVLLEPTTKTTTKTGIVRLVGADYFYLYDDTTKYEMAASPQVYKNGVSVTYPADFIARILVDDTVEIFRDTTGKVTTLKATRFDKTHQIVTNIMKTGAQGTWNISAKADGTAAPVVYYLADDCVVVLNGQQVPFTALEITSDNDMIVSIQTEGGLGTTAKRIEATTKTVSGKVTAKRVAVDAYNDSVYYISIDGVEYRLESGASIKNTATNTPAGTYAGVLINDIVEVNLSLRNRVKLVEKTGGSASYARFLTKQELAGPSLYDKWVVDVRGVSTTYEVSKNSPPLIAPVHGQFIKMVFDDDGRIAAGSTILTLTGEAPPSTKGVLVQEVYAGDKLIKLGGAFFTVGSSAIVYANEQFATLSAVTKDSRVRYFQEDPASSKIDLLVADTYAKVDMSKISAIGNLKVKSLDYFVEPFATVEFFKEATLTTALTLAPVVTDKYGKLAETTLADPFAAGVTSGTIYLRITDPFGMVTTATMTLRK